MKRKHSAYERVLCDLNVSVIVVVNGGVFESKIQALDSDYLLASRLIKRSFLLRSLERNVFWICSLICKAQLPITQLICSGTTARALGFRNEYYQSHIS